MMMVVNVIMFSISHVCIQQWVGVDGACAATMVLTAASMWRGGVANATTQ
jgi:hypothetical protein